MDGTCRLGVITACGMLLACSGATDGGARTGADGSGGAGGAGGSGSVVSPGKASIAFTVGGADGYCMTSQCGDGPSIGIKDASGKALALATNCSQIPCQTCQMQGCPGFACQPMGIGVTGASMEWDGRIYASSTCGSGTTCTEPVYAPAGRYTATLCATRGRLVQADGGSPECVTAGPPECSSVEFDLPSSVTVKGKIGS